MHLIPKTHCCLLSPACNSFSLPTSTAPIFKRFIPTKGNKVEILKGFLYITPYLYFFSSALLTNWPQDLSFPAGTHPLWLTPEVLKDWNKRGQERRKPCQLFSGNGKHNSSAAIRDCRVEDWPNHGKQFILQNRLGSENRFVGEKRQKSKETCLEVWHLWILIIMFSMCFTHITFILTYKDPIRSQWGK